MTASLGKSAALTGTAILCALQFAASLATGAAPGQSAKPTTQPATTPAKPFVWPPAVRWLTGERVPNMLRSPASWAGQHVWLVRAEPLNGTDGRAIPGLLRLVVERSYNTMPAPAAITMPANALGDDGQAYYRLLVPGERIILWHVARTEAWSTAPTGRSGLFCRVGGAATSKPDAELLNSLDLIGAYRHAAGDPRQSANPARDILASRLDIAVSYLCQEMLDGSGPLSADERQQLLAVRDEPALPVHTRLLASRVLHSRDAVYASAGEHLRWVRGWFAGGRTMDELSWDRLLAELDQTATPDNFESAVWPLLADALAFRSSSGGEVSVILDWISHAHHDGLYFKTATIYRFVEFLYDAADKASRPVDRLHRFLETARGLLDRVRQERVLKSVKLDDVLEFDAKLAECMNSLRRLGGRVKPEERGAIDRQLEWLGYWTKGPRMIGQWSLAYALPTTRPDTLATLMGLLTYSRFNFKRAAMWQATVSQSQPDGRRVETTVELDALASGKSPDIKLAPDDIVAIRNTAPPRPMPVWVPPPPATQPAKWVGHLPWPGEYPPLQLTSSRTWDEFLVLLVRVAPVRSADGQLVDGMVRLIVEANYKDTPAPAEFIMPGWSLTRDTERPIDGESAQPGSRLMMMIWLPKNRPGVHSRWATDCCPADPGATSGPDAGLVRGLELVSEYRRTPAQARAKIQSTILASCRELALEYLFWDWQDNNRPGDPDYRSPSADDLKQLRVVRDDIGLTPYTRLLASRMLLYYKAYRSDDEHRAWVKQWFDRPRTLDGWTWGLLLGELITTSPATTQGEQPEIETAQWPIISKLLTSPELDDAELGALLQLAKNFTSANARTFSPAGRHQVIVFLLEQAARQADEKRMFQFLDAGCYAAMSAHYQYDRGGVSHSTASQAQVEEYLALVRRCQAKVTVAPSWQMENAIERLEALKPR